MFVVEASGIAILTKELIGGASRRDGPAQVADGANKPRLSN